MTIDIHALLGKKSNNKKLLQPKFGYKYLGPYNKLENQLSYNKNTGQIYKYYDKPKNKLDEITSRHDTCYSISKNKNECDRIMVNEINDIPYNQRPWGTFGVKQMINTKQKLGMGNNFTMDDLSEELNKPIIHKFKRKRTIVNYIDHIHSADLVDMKKYSNINKGYSYIFANIDIFSKYAWAFPIKSKKYNMLNYVFKKYSKKEDQNTYGEIKNQHFSAKKC